MLYNFFFSCPISLLPAPKLSGFLFLSPRCTCNASFIARNEMHLEQLYSLFLNCHVEAEPLWNSNKPNRSLRHFPMALSLCAAETFNIPSGMHCGNGCLYFIFYFFNMKPLFCGELTFSRCFFFLIPVAEHCLSANTQYWSKTGQ